jgi:hypothetical protein
MVNVNRHSRNEHYGAKGTRTPLPQLPTRLAECGHVRRRPGVRLVIVTQLVIQLDTPATAASDGGWFGVDPCSQFGRAGESFVAVRGWG